MTDFLLNPTPVMDAYFKLSNNQTLLGSIRAACFESVTKYARLFITP